MEVFVAQLINGVATGAIFAIIAVAINLLLLVKGVFHYSLVHIAVISMYICWIVLGRTDNNIALAIPICILGAVILNVVTEPLFRPLVRRKANMETWILSIGIGIILTEIMSQQLNHGIPVGFPAGLVGGGGQIRAGLIYISLANIYTIVVGLAAVLVFYYFLFRSKEGRALRAIAQDNRVARLLGIPLNRSGIYSFAIAGLFAGIIAVLLVMTLGAASGSLGDLLAMKAFIIVMFAGTGNLKGGIICALAVGVVQALCQAYLPGSWTQAIIFAAILVVVIIRPQGVFGGKA